MGNQPVSESNGPADAVAGAARPTAKAEIARRRTAAPRDERGRILDMRPSVPAGRAAPPWPEVESRSGRTPGAAGRVGPIGARLYWFPLSHPAQAARVMLELKGVDHELTSVLPGLQRIHLRLAGFRGGTVPALKLDGRRVQGSHSIARALERLRPQPPLFPAEASALARVEEAERWGDEELQPVPRIILRWGLVRHAGLRRWLAQESGLPAPGLAALLSVPAAWYYARVVAADQAAVRRALAGLGPMLDQADALLADGVLAP